MDQRMTAAIFLIALAAAVPRGAAVCPPCSCSSVAGVVQSVTCTHMSMDMYGIPGRIPPSTRHLDLSGHGIKNIRRNDFSSLTELVNLSVADNRIETVDAFSFSQLSNLRSLNLHGNLIETVNEQTFAGLTKLKRLDLSGNQISRVSRGTFANITSLSVLNLSNNPLYCDCDIAWAVLQQSFPPLHTPLAPPPTCAGPANLAGRHVNQLSIEELGCIVPGVVAAESSVAAYMGESVVLSCLVSGASISDLVWYHGGQGVTSGVQSNGSLFIESMQQQLEGEYTCVSSNMAGSGNASITVTYLGVVMPRITTSPSHTHAFPGESISLQCAGDHYTMSYQWLHSGLILMASDRVSITPGVGLTISPVTEEDSGIYTCVAMGTEGSVEASAQLSVTGPLISCAGVIDADTVEEIRSMVRFAFNNSALTNVSSPHQLLRRLKLPDDASIELLIAADVFQQALQTVRNGHRGNSQGGVPSLSECEINVLAELSGCLEHGAPPNCSDICFHRRYRSVDGSCNNWVHPSWGMADTPLLRLLPPAYEDGLGLPVGWSGGRPSARLISQRVIRAQEVEPDQEFTHMLMQFGQFVDHDIDLAPGTPSDVAFSSGAMCGSQCTNTAPCFPIPVEEGDTRISAECIPFTRSGGVCGSGPSSLLVGSSAIYRNQLNAITSFLDGSQIYASTEDHSQQLRDRARPGWLLEGISGPTGKPLLPFDTHSTIECSTGINSHRSQCFLAGDVRANEQVGLTAMHTLFFREHNRVASFLSHVNPHWDQEKIFQETRRNVIAEWQHIIYSEYLPAILGPSGMQQLGSYRGYNPDVNPTIANSFATAAYRFGHSQIQPVFHRLNESYLPHTVGPLNLRDAFFSPFRLLEEGGVDPMIRGLIASPGKKRSSQSGLVSDLTEALFQQVHEVALDLAALNIQRGRDHGLPSYLEWRRLCNLPTDEPLMDIGDAMVRTKLMEVYEDEAEHIELWVGGLLEDLLPGGQLGPTFTCIIAQQFQRLREGDRFWFERSGQFSPDQLVALKEASLSRIICDNADGISRVPRDAFTLQPVSEFSECSDLPFVDLNLWTECPEEGATVERRSVLMSSVEEEVQQLRAAVESLQSRARSSCVVNGVEYVHSEEWEMGPCTHCHCQSGAVTCSHTSC